MIETADLARFGLLLVRPGMLVATAPVFGGVYVPTPVRIGLGVLLGIVVAPIVPSPDRLGEVGLAIMVAGEAAIGLTSVTRAVKPGTTPEVALGTVFALPVKARRL